MDFKHIGVFTRPEQEWEYWYVQNVGSRGGYATQEFSFYNFNQNQTIHVHRTDGQLGWMMDLAQGPKILHKVVFYGHFLISIYPNQFPLLIAQNKVPKGKIAICNHSEYTCRFGK